MSEERALVERGKTTKRAREVFARVERVGKHNSVVFFAAAALRSTISFRVVVVVEMLIEKKRIHK